MKFLKSVFGMKDQGVIVEIGFRDVASIERKWLLDKGWKDVVVEAFPTNIEELRQINNQSIYVLNTCVTPKAVQVRRFQQTSQIISKDSSIWEFISSLYEPVKFYFMPCFSINTIITALGLSRVQFFSLDNNGNELEILETLDFDNFDIILIRVRQSIYEKRRDLVIKLMVKKGYLLKRQINSDMYFIKKHFKIY